MKKEESKLKKVLMLILMLLISVLFYAGMAYLRGKAIRDIFVIAIMMCVGTGCTIFSLIQSDIADSLHYDNSEHYSRFILIYDIGVVASVLFVLIPSTAWVFPGIALALSLFSNAVTGVIGYGVLLSVCVYLSGENSMIFALYFIVGTVFIILFEKLDKEYKTGIPLMTAMLIYSVSLISYVVFKSKGDIELEIFLIPIINIFITIVISLGALRFFCALIIDKEKGQYLEINDQEFELLAKYKQENPELYYNAIHTSYFTEKLARLRNMDVDLAKNGGYYHKIILAECKKQNKSLEEICRSYHFPENAIKLLQEYGYKSQKISMREAVNVYLVDAVVTSLLYVISKEENKDKEIEYGKLAVAIIRRKLNSGELNESYFAIGDITEMEKMFTGEKLYYDFLRRE